MQCHRMAFVVGGVQKWRKGGERAVIGLSMSAAMPR